MVRQAKLQRQVIELAARDDRRATSRWPGGLAEATRCFAIPPLDAAAGQAVKLMSARTRPPSQPSASAASATVAKGPPCCFSNSASEAHPPRHHHHRVDGAGAAGAFQAQGQPDPGCRAAAAGDQHHPIPGASPVTVEREVVNRIEKSLSSISGVDRIQATAAEGYARFVIFFNFQKNMVEAGMRSAMRSPRCATNCRPKSAGRCCNASTRQPIMQLALSSSTLSHATISRLAEDQLADRFRGISGVAVVNVNGSLKRELSVLLKADKLRENQVSVTDVVNALRARTPRRRWARCAAPGRPEHPLAKGKHREPAEFGQIVVVRRRGDEVIRLGQIATVVDGFAEPAGYSLRNGQPNVNISITRSRDASTVSVANQIHASSWARSAKELPKGTKLIVTQDGGKNAENSLNNVIDALVFGAGLTVFVVYLF